VRAFIADDSAIVRDRLATLLADVPKGVEFVGYAYDCPGALEAIRRLRPDVVIPDIRMPGGSAIEVAERVKNIGTSAWRSGRISSSTSPTGSTRCARSSVRWFSLRTERAAREREERP
jgi:DNA-binding NarL/FixJ family response regulator